MNGMEMLLKSFGFDPNEMRKQIEEPIKQMIAGVQAIGSRLAQIDARLDQIERILNIVPVPVIEYHPGDSEAERKRA